MNSTGTCSLWSLVLFDHSYWPININISQNSWIMCSSSMHNRQGTVEGVEVGAQNDRTEMKVLVVVVVGTVPCGINIQCRVCGG